MGSKTIKRLAIVAAVLALTIVAVVVIQRRQVTQMGRSNLAKAEQAVEGGDLKAAEDLYLQHIRVFPDDLDAKLKYADTLLKGSKTPARSSQAHGIYAEVLRRDPGRQDVRRILAESQATSGQEDDARQARNNLTILMTANPGDGGLEYLMGRCQETLKEDAEAAKSYKLALSHGATEKFDAYQRLAGLLRGPLNEPKQADDVIEEMVKSNPDDYRAYLERGNYRFNQLEKSPDELKRIEADYQAALKLAPKEPSIYLQLARVALQRKPPDKDEAVRVLRAGLDADPKEVMLYRMLAWIEENSGKPDDAIETYRRGIELLPDSALLRIFLAELIAPRGATAELLSQAEELKRIGAAFYPDYYTAYYHFNMHDWPAARKILAERLQQVDYSSRPLERAKVNDLLAKCYERLGDPERRRTALASSLRDNPRNLDARRRWVEDLASQGEVAQAIDEYRKLVAEYPRVIEFRLALVRLLIGRNQQLPAARRDWAEVGDLLDVAEKDAPGSPQVLVARAQMLLSQGKASEAQALLEKARAGAGASEPVVWTALAELILLQGNYPAALKVLDEARAKLGDRFELRTTRARVLSARGGPEANAALVALAGDLGALPADQRPLLVDTIAGILTARNDVADAARLWTEACALAPNDLALRQKLFSLGVQQAERADAGRDKASEEQTKSAIDEAVKIIEQALAEIKRIDGADGNNTRQHEITYKLLQARLNAKSSPDESSRLRAEARTLIAELTSRRPDWSVVPLLNAQLDEMELDPAILDDGRKLTPDEQRRLSRLADLYRQAIDMGQRNLLVVRRATKMLIASGRAAEVNQLWNKVPSLAGDGNLSGVERALLGNANQDNALEIVRQRVESRPNDFAERILLAQYLVKEKRFDEAEAELRKALDLDRTDPNRWVALVQFLVSVNQIEKAEKVAREAEKAAPADKLPLIMAQCASQIGLGYQATAREPQKVKWYSEAKAWYQKAQAARPGEFAIRQATVDFLLQTGQFADVEGQLAPVLARPDGFNADDVDWAKRTQALSLVMQSEVQNNYQAALRALKFFAPQGDDAKQYKSPADLRALARVYEAQKIPFYRKKAAEVLEKLDADRLASDEDRFLLAKLYNAGGEWDKARDEYKQLMEELGPPDSALKLNRRVTFLTQYANDLIAHVPHGESQEAKDAQGLIDQVKAIRPDWFGVLSLQAHLDKAMGKPVAAVAKLKEIADKPGLQPALALASAGLAEDVGELDLAQRLFKVNAAASPRLQDRLAYAAFLGRQGRIKEAVDVCEPLWNAAPNPEPLVTTVIEALFPAKTEPDAAQVERVSQWVERSIKQNPKSTLFLIALGNIRERQKRYAEAEDLYRQVIKQGGNDVIPLNNLAWLMALKGNKGAVPLDLINRAIALRGPIPEFLDTRAIVYLTNGESKRAIEDLEDAVAIAPSATKYFHLAQAYLEASNKEAAKQNLEKARTKGLAKGNLHPLELTAYQQVISALD
jgi:tetratricopeptide (TPR) repeat protein